MRYKKIHGDSTTPVFEVLGLETSPNQDMRVVEYRETDEAFVVRGHNDGQTVSVALLFGGAMELTTIYLSAKRQVTLQVMPNGDVRRLHQKYTKLIGAVGPIESAPSRDPSKDRDFVKEAVLSVFSTARSVLKIG